MVALTPQRPRFAPLTGSFAAWQRHASVIVRHRATLRGTYRHTLVRERGQLRIKLPRIDMVNAQAPYDYVLQVWVERDVLRSVPISLPAYLRHEPR